MNSNFNKGGSVKTRYSSNTGSFACDGGAPTDFATFYLAREGKKRFIPWSNGNAGYADYNAGQPGGYNGGYKTLMPASIIKTSPSYSISRMSVKEIQTFGVGSVQAIENIKTALRKKHAVHFNFQLPNKAAWDSFDKFWNEADENTFFNFDPYSGIPYEEGSGGHSVILVGYDDRDPDVNNHYWKILNSWGVTASRPNGIFKIPIQMNYDNNDGTDTGQNLYFNEILPTFTETDKETY